MRIRSAVFEWLFTNKMADFLLWFTRNLAIESKLNFRKIWRKSKAVECLLEWGDELLLFFRYFIDDWPSFLHSIFVVTIFDEAWQSFANAFWGILFKLIDYCNYLIFPHSILFNLLFLCLHFIPHSFSSDQPLCFQLFLRFIFFFVNHLSQFSKKLSNLTFNKLFLFVQKLKYFVFNIFTHKFLLSFLLSFH